MKTIWDEQKTKLLHDVRAILDRAQTEQRNLTDDESQTIDRIFADVERLSKQIEAQRKTEALERAMEQRTPVLLSGAAAHGDEDRGRSAFVEYIRRGVAQMPHETRALLSGSGGGSYLVPTVLYDQIMTRLAELSPMRQLATVIRTAAKTDIPVASGSPTAAYTAENTATSPSDPTLATKALRAKKLVTITQVSEELLMDSQFDIESYIAGQIAMAFAAAEDAGFVAGNGTTQPEGVVSAVTAGPTASGTTALTGDNLIDLYFALPAQYRARSVFLMRSATMAYIAKLKDSQNRYLWLPPFGAGEMSTILGRPIYLDENVPAMAASARSIVVFDPKFYVIADRLEMTLQRLEELYIANGLKAFRAVARNDGAMTLADAGRALVHPST